MKYVLFVAAILSFSFSCNKENNPSKTASAIESIEQSKQQDNSIKPNSETSEMQDVEINFLTKQGSYWEYTTKDFANGILGATREYKQTITGIEGPYIYINGQKEYKIEDGKIFKTFATRGGAETNGLYFFIPKNNKEQYSSLVGGDVVVEATVKKAQSSVTVPAGTFNNCYVFTIHNESFYVEPSVGIVRRTSGKKGSQYYQTEELIRYKVS